MWQIYYLVGFTALSVFGCAAKFNKDEFSSWLALAMTLVAFYCTIRMVV